MKHRPPFFESLNLFWRGLPRGGRVATLVVVAAAGTISAVPLLLRIAPALFRLNSGVSPGKGPGTAHPTPPPVMVGSPPPTAMWTPGVSASPPPTAPTATSGRPPQEAYWNSWVRESGARGEAKRVEPDHDYDVNFDLAARSYAERSAAAAATQVDPAFQKTLSAAGQTLRVTVKPFLVGRGLEFLPGFAETESVEFELEKLRHPPQDVASTLSLPAYADLAKALRVTVGVHATEPGCAVVGLSIWNASLNRPLDYVARELRVGNPADAPDCGNARTSRPMTGQLVSLLTNRTGAVADAALHVFEIKVRGHPSVSVAVFLRSGEREALSWRLSRSLPDFLSLPGFVKDLSTARRSKNYGDLSHALTTVLFPTSTDHGGTAPADVAMRALRDLLSRRPSANVFVRLVDIEGQSVFLPLGLLDVGGGQVLARSAAILQPLPGEEAPLPGRCVGPWTMVLPRSLGAEFVDQRFLRPVGTPVERRISDFGDLREYLRIQPSQSRTGEGFLLLAHHDSGFVKLNPEASETLLAEDVKRTFPRGSVAVLAACATGQLSGDNRRLPLLKELAAHNIETAVLSPFPVDGPFGARFAHHFAHAVDEARRNHEGPDLRELFHRAAKGVREEGLVFADQAYEFVLAGNADIRLCK